MEARIKTIKTNLKQAVEVISKSFKEAKNQRPTKMSGADSFMMSIIHWVSFDSPGDNFIDDLFCGAENVSSDKPIFIKLAYSLKNKGLYSTIEGFPLLEVQDGQHRIKYLKSIFDNAISVPKESPLEAYEWVSKKYGGKYFNELPKQIQKKLENLTTIITVMETDRPSEKAALFYSDNCGRTISTRDILNNSYCHTAMWEVLNELISLVKSKDYISDNEFKLNKTAYRNLHNNFASLSNNSLLNFFVRNMLAVKGWEGSTQLSICNNFFKGHRNTSYEKSLRLVSEMTKRLNYAQKFFVCEDKGLTLYTAMVSFAFGTLDKEGRKLFDENSRLISQRISSWCTMGVGIGKNPSDSIFGYMSNSFYQMSRVNKAKDFYNSLYIELS